MKPKRISKLRLARPADVLLPLALLIASALGRFWLAGELYIYIFAVRMAGLSTATGLRAAFAMQPSMKKVCGSVKVALLIQLGGAAVVCAGYGILIDPPRSHALWMLASALTLNIEHVFYEYLYATGDGPSAALCRFITSALTCAGLLLAARASWEYIPPYQESWLAGATGVAVLVSAVIAVAIGGRLVGRPNARVIRCAPLSMLHTGLYPVTWALGLIALNRLTNTDEFAQTLGFFAGLALYEVCRTPFRRSEMESRVLIRALWGTFGTASVLFGLSLILRGHATGIAAQVFSAAPAAVLLSVALAALCAFLLFCRLPRRGEA